MRIIAGKYKGHGLYCPRGVEIRPTSDKARGALFNIIGSSIAGSSFLDLFAGTGAVGLEALSRGAARVTAVEMYMPDITQKNARKLGAGPDSGYTLIRGDAFIEGRKYRSSGVLFDFIFADPPWGSGLEESVIKLAAPLLAEGGRLILEFNKRTGPPDGGPQGLALIDTRRYGMAVFCFYIPSGDEQK